MEKDKILLELMESKRFKTKKAFADYLGISDQLLNQWLKRPYFDIDIVRSRFPDVDEKWLLTGEGEMKKPGYLVFDKNGVPNVSSHKQAPLIPFEVSNDIGISIKEFCDEYPDRVDVYEPSQLYPIFDYIYKMNQNNMSPVINPGDLLYIKRISIENIINGHCYLVDTKKHGANVYKVIVQGDNIVCKSISEHYMDVEINVSDLFDIYKIVGQFSYSVDVAKDVFRLKQDLTEKDAVIQKLSEELYNSGKRIDALLTLLKK